MIDILKEWRGVWGVVYVYVARINGELEWGVLGTVLQWRFGFHKSGSIKTENF